MKEIGCKKFGSPDVLQLKNNICLFMLQRVNPLVPHMLQNIKRLYQKSELALFYSSPTTKAVGSNFVTSIEPTL
jgi:hypothetical protein